MIINLKVKLTYLVYVVYEGSTNLENQDGMESVT
jgi:hypothetical protein